VSSDHDTTGAQLLTEREGRQSLGETGDDAEPIRPTEVTDRVPDGRLETSILLQAAAGRDVRWNRAGREDSAGGGEPERNSTATTDEMPTGDETILLVEDEDAVRRIARRILEKLGFRVIEASNGFEALAVAGDYDDVIHLVLSDVVMPHMSGKECVDRLMKIRHGLKVLYMSGYTVDAIAHQGVLDEGTNFIQKPFSLRSLAFAIRKAMNDTNPKDA